MNCLNTTTLFFTLALCALTHAHAQVRKAPLPADSGVLNVSPPILPYDSPSKNEGLSPEKVFGNPYQPPEYPGGQMAILRFVESNLKIPTQAKEAGVSGKVFITFIVEETGEITDISVLKGLGFGCDEEAVRIVKAMPCWKPGRAYNKPNRGKYVLPISFVTK